MSEKAPKDLKTLHVDGTDYRTRLTRKFGLRKPWTPADPNVITAYIPGVIKQIGAVNGQRVHQGDALFVLEAMKMQNTVVAPRDGVVRRVAVREADIVTKGQVLLELEPLD